MRASALRRKNLLSDPVKQFKRWFEQASKTVGPQEAQAMCLSTIDRKGRPDGRIVLLKQADERGFVFYTNARSTKGRSLKNRPQAALTFYWDPLERQVRVQGNVAEVAAAEADAYFRTRARASRIGAWASEQSQTLAARSEL